MTRVRAAIPGVFLVVALMVGLCFMGQPAIAQNPAPDNDAKAQPQPDNQNSTSEARTFTGTIMKTGGKLVLSDAEGKTTYQLDDQTKAKAFLNKSVKVTGVLDTTTGMIRVSAIEPAA